MKNITNKLSELFIILFTIVGYALVLAGSAGI